MNDEADAVVSRFQFDRVVQHKSLAANLGESRFG